MADIDSVLVAGATGGTGREILTQLRNTDLHVRAQTRSTEKAADLARRGVDEVAVADLLELDDARSLVEGCDAVLCAVGTPPGPGHLVGRRLVDGEGVRRLIDAAASVGIDLFVYESAIGVGDSREAMPAPFRALIRRSLRAKGESEARLRASRLDHVIVRPGKLTDGPATGVPVVTDGGETAYGPIARADVARLMVGALFTPEARNRTFEVVNEPWLRSEVGDRVEIEWAVPERRPVGSDAGGVGAGRPDGNG
ncbi:SDR family oxidoreductase [Natronorarus salvus]|uniref:SDR family oxidoreductase n=1 Tax=Natronorarus salvus TaxID=3117733 RepID=UPI002F269F6F